MDIKEVKELIQEILRSDISEFELEHTGTKVRLRRGLAAGAALQSPAPISAEERPVSHAPQITVDPVIRAQAEASAEENGLHIITSPIVGTFYRTPAPGAEPFVKVGSAVDEGSILCIVEAMKLVNEIPSDTAGEIAAIYPENGQPVEYGQKLFGIRPHR